MTLCSDIVPRRAQDSDRALVGVDGLHTHCSHFGCLVPKSHDCRLLERHDWLAILSFIWLLIFAERAEFRFARRMVLGFGIDPIAQPLVMDSAAGSVSVDRRASQVFSSAVSQNRRHSTHWQIQETEEKFVTLHFVAFRWLKFISIQRGHAADIWSEPLAASVQSCGVWLKSTWTNWSHSCLHTSPQMRYLC